MKLFYSEASPYSRKVRLTVLEKGLQEQVETILCNPFVDVTALKAVNPLGKVPALVLDDGDVLYDSPVICAWLDSQSAINPLIPEAGKAHWRVRRCEALADGILDAAYNVVMERRRPDGERSADWIQRWTGEITHALTAVEAEVDDLGDRVTLAHLAVASALGYLAFRLHGLDWRSSCPAATAWYDVFRMRTSMRETQPE